ncbi:MAG: sigma-54 interaction domain-containing protein [Negativicutes bacterium]
MIKRVVDIAKDYARTESNILITGETGTGKEVFAQSIHNHSQRKKGPFVAVNCAALPSQLLESELFGYVKGAFTGANKEGKPGLFEVAHGGTIFLDEISELDYVNQGRLLRVLQEKTVVRLGSDKVVPVDVRIIAATNKDLGLEVAEKKFRDDLFYRLNVLKLILPPLRERVIDIKDYAMNFLERYLPADRQSMTFRPGALRVLEKFDWPGNIRQLQNTIQRAAVLCKEPFINEATIAHCLDVPDKRPNLQSGLTQEIEAIRQALVKAKGKQTEAAKALGINRSTLWRKMQRLGIS